MPPANNVVKFVKSTIRRSPARLSFWRHPQESVEFFVPLHDERMRPVQVNGLACEELDRICVVAGQLVMRQVGMEIERGDVFKKLELVQVAEGGGVARCLLEPLTTAGWSPY